MRKTMERLSIRLPPELANNLRQYAMAGHISLSEGVRSILIQYFALDTVVHDVADAAIHSRAVFELLLAMTAREHRANARRSALSRAVAGLKKRRDSRALQPDDEE